MKRISRDRARRLPRPAGLALAQEKFAYTELKPAQPTESAAGKIEVLEFFWYGCPHCYSLEPAIEAWTKKLPADVQFRRVPAVFNERWAHDAAIFYTFEALGVLDKLHRPFFDAIHRDRLRTDDQQALSRVAAEERRRQQSLLRHRSNPSACRPRVRRATQLTVAYRIDGTPAMAVQGRYTVSAEQGRSHQGMIDTVDYLARHREEAEIRVVITGASSGIGEALARHYASQGATLGLIARRPAGDRQLQRQVLPGRRHRRARDGAPPPRTSAFPISSSPTPASRPGRAAKTCATSSICGGCWK